MLAVIIPVYNRPQQFEEALRSLTIQTKKRFITVIVDDASEEDVFSITKKYSNLLHIVYLRQENNGGPGKARARGLQWCFDNNIELVMFLDSDDLLLPKAIERLSKEINVTRNDMIVSEIQGEDKFGFSWTIDDNETIWNHGKIYRVSFLKQIGLNFPDIKMNEDVAFNTVAFYAAKSRKTVAKIAEQHYLWKWEENSMTRLSNKKEVICKSAKGFIEAIKFCVEKFQDLNLDLNLLFPKVRGMYVFVQYLKKYGEYDASIKKKVEEVYNNSNIKQLIRKNLSSNKENLFSTLPNGAIYLEQNFMFEQTAIDFLKEHVLEMI